MSAPSTPIPPTRQTGSLPGQSQRELDRELDPAALDPNADNVRTLAQMHSQAERAVGRHQRFIETLTAAIGRPRTLYGLLAAVLLWVAYNALAPRLRVPRFDPPPFAWLQGLISLLALTMTSMVLITQNRQAKSAARRGLLDLHVNLLSEQKVAKLIALLEELRRDLPSVENRQDAQAEVMARPVDPQAVITTIEQTLEQAIHDQPSTPGQAAMAAEGIAEVARDADEARTLRNAAPASATAGIAQPLATEPAPPAARRAQR